MMNTGEGLRYPLFLKNWETVLSPGPEDSHGVEGAPGISHFGTVGLGERVTLSVSQCPPYKMKITLYHVPRCL